MSVGVFGCCCPPNPPCVFSISFETPTGTLGPGEAGDYVSICSGSWLPASILPSSTITTSILNAQLFCDFDQITEGVTWAIAVYCKKLDVYPDWDIGTTYALGDKVTQGSSNYQSRINSNTGNDPGSSPTQWLLLTGACDPDNAFLLPQAGNGTFYDPGTCDLADPDDIPVGVTDNTDPLTTFTADLTGLYGQGLGGDFNVIISITATYLGVSYTTYGYVNFHFEPL